MDLKHIEDFVSLCGTRSFSRSALARNVTQSAFSRRIQALELWLGASLVDRSTFPTTLTDEGRAFRETAEEVLRMLHDARADVHARRGRSRRTISFAALHTLALTFFPTWLRQIQDVLGPLNTELLSDSSHNCVQSLVEGDSDFLLTFHHDAAPVSIDPERFPFVVLGHDRLLATTGMENGKPLFDFDGESPVLSYGKASFLGRLSTYATRAANLDLPSTHVNDSALAEALKAMVLAGHGIAWLPECLIQRELVSGQLCDLGYDISMEIRLYRSTEKIRYPVEQVWELALAQS